MKKEKLKTQIEVFVCNHKRDNDECCADKGAKELTDHLRRWAKEEHKGEVKIFRSGCLGKCSEGIVVACFPEKKLLLEVTVHDSKEIIQGLREALNK